MVEDYFSNHKKYNKVLWKYLELKNEDDSKEKEISDSFMPHYYFEFLSFTMYMIKKKSNQDFIIKIVQVSTQIDTEVYIQHIFEANTPQQNIVNIVYNKEKSEHRAVYNACVNYILKTT